MRFGNDIKTIYVVCVPVSEGRTVVHYKLYRNFMFLHPRDESWVNKVRAVRFGVDGVCMCLGGWAGGWVVTGR